MIRKTRELKWLKEEKKLKRKRKLKKLRKEEEDSLVFFFFNKLRFSWRLRGKRFFYTLSETSLVSLTVSFGVTLVSLETALAVSLSKFRFNALSNFF